MWRGWLLLHKQGLSQLSLVLLDLLLHVIDCTCNLATTKNKNKSTNRRQKQRLTALVIITLTKNSKDMKLKPVTPYLLF